jgi:hypothetical protein
MGGPLRIGDVIRSHRLMGFFPRRDGILCIGKMGFLHGGPGAEMLDELQR